MHAATRTPTEIHCMGCEHRCRVIAPRLVRAVRPFTLSGVIPARTFRTIGDDLFIFTTESWLIGVGEAEGTGGTEIRISYLIS